MNILSKIKSGLAKTRAQIGAIIDRSPECTPEFFEQLEEALIAADSGASFAAQTIDLLKKEIKLRAITGANEAYELLKSMLAAKLSQPQKAPSNSVKPWIVLIVGVNGVGKTTTIGKLAQEYRLKGKKVLLGAADTFRAGAIEQLRIWAQKTESDFVAQHEGADPASVAFDALEAAKSRDCDVLILDTAGRLHNKVNLMNELEKIVRVIRRNIPDAPHEVLLVLDATTGQNAIKQTEVFHQSIGLTGCIITKLDGTAKGGVALSLSAAFGIPIRKIGVGEAMTDLQDFNAEAYIEAMFGTFEVA